MERIFVDPARLEITAQRVESSKADYDRLVNLLYAEVDKLQTNWQGKENTEFTNKIKQFQNDFRQIAIILNQYAQFLRSSARAYRETQEELYSSASRLRTGG